MYTSNGGNRIARITSRILFASGSPALFAFLYFFHSFFTSFRRSFFSLRESDLNSLIAAFTLAESGSVDVGTIAEETGGTTAANAPGKVDPMVTKANTSRRAFLIV